MSEADARAGKPYGSFSLVVLAAASEASEAGLVTTLFPAIQAGLGLAASDLGIIVACNKLSASLCSPLWVWLAARWSRKGVLVAAAGLAGAMGMGVGCVDSFAALLVLSCAVAASHGGTVPLITTLLADLFADRHRGRATGLLYGAIGLMAAISGVLFAHLLRGGGGWRIGFWLTGAATVAVAAAIGATLRDPVMGAMDRAEPGDARRLQEGLAASLRLFRVPSFNLMLLSRLLSGHLVITGFGILFLTSVRQFSNATAALVLVPFGLGVCLGTVVGGFLADWMHARWPRTGRVALLQWAQFGFALVAYGATQPAWTGIEAYMAFWLAMGCLQGVNPGVNRPIVIAVVPPELRAWAFFIMLAVVEPVGWAGYSLGLWWFQGHYGLQAGFLVVLVGTMILNGFAITPLYFTYGPDNDRMRAYRPIA